MPTYPDPETLNPDKPELFNLYDALVHPSARPNNVRLRWTSSQTLQTFETLKVLFEVYEGNLHNFVPKAYFDNAYVDLVVNNRLKKRLELFPNTPPQPGQDEEGNLFPVTISAEEINAKLNEMHEWMLTNYQQVVTWVVP